MLKPSKPGDAWVLADVLLAGIGPNNTPDGVDFGVAITRQYRLLHSHDDLSYTSQTAAKPALQYSPTWQALHPW